MIKRVMLALGMALMAAFALLVAGTEPGRIATTADAGIAPYPPSYLEQLRRAEEKDPSKIVVWVGKGLDTGHSAIIPEAVPILFDKADVGKPMARVRPETRAKVKAVIDRQEAILRVNGRKGIEEQVRAWIRDLDTVVSLADAHGGLSQWKDDGAFVRATRDELVSQADRFANDIATSVLETEPVPDIPPGCNYGDPECAGCYTDLGNLGAAKLCGLACVDCVPRPKG